MTNKYTSLELSRLIQSNVPEADMEEYPRYCGGHTWYYESDEGIHEECEETAAVIQEDEYCESASLVCEKTYPRYRLDDVIQAIKVWGEKQGWKPTEYTIGDSRVCLIHGDEDLVDCDGTEYDPGGLGCAMCGDSIGDLVYRDEYHSHRLLTAYLADDGFGERCERVIKSIFEEV